MNQILSKKIKNKSYHATSFTILYGASPTDEKSWKQLSVTAQNEKEASLWTQSLKILSDAAKKEANIQKTESSSPSESYQNHSKSQSTVINGSKTTFDSKLIWKTF